MNEHIMTKRLHSFQSISLGLFRVSIISAEKGFDLPYQIILGIFSINLGEEPISPDQVSNSAPTKLRQSQNTKNS